VVELQLITSIIIQIIRIRDFILEGLMSIILGEDIVSIHGDFNLLDGRVVFFIILLFYGIVIYKELIRIIWDIFMD